MPRNLSEAPYTVSHALSQRAFDDSMSFRLGSSSIDETSEKHVEFGNRRVLTKSRSISASNARIESAGRRFQSAPLLPTVRRLNSSPASSKPVTTDIGDGETISTLRVSMETPTPDKINFTNGDSPPTNGDPALNDRVLDEPGTSTSSPTFSVRRIDERHCCDEGNVRGGALDDNMVVLAGGESDSMLSDSSKVNSKSSFQNEMETWKYRSRTETEGNDFLMMRPAKSQRTAADQATRLGSYTTDDVDKFIFPKVQKDGGVSPTNMGEVEFPSNERFSTRFKAISRLPSRPHAATAAKPPQRRSLATKVSQETADSKIYGVGPPTLHPSAASKFPAQVTDSKSHDSRPPINVRRRRLPESSESRQASDVWLNESKRLQQTGAGSVDGVSAVRPSKPHPSKLASLVRWTLRHNTLLSGLLAIMCTSSLLYSMVQREEITLLKDENTRLKSYGVGSCQCHRTLETYSEPQERLGDIDAKTEMPSNEWKLLLGLFVLLVCGSFLSKSCIDLPYWIGKRRDRRITEEEVPISKRVAYLVDVLFSTHSYAKAVALLLATLLLIGFGGFSLYAVNDERLSDALWRSWTYVADSGNHADSVGIGPRIVSVSISIGGMLIFALMLGLVSDAISEKVDSLRKGKSEVIESNHTLILGWSDKLGSLLKQLAIANQSMGGGVVVVLAERDKEEMELDIAKLEFDFMGTSVICRSGSPLIMADLKKVSVSKARAIIVLAEVENADQSDARALRVVLSLTAVKEGLRGHIVVELSDLDNEPLVKLVGQEMVETVVAHDVIGRLMIQCARQPGLAQIWEDILGFDNAEFYLKRWPQLDGMRFEDVLISFPEAIPCGLKVAAEKGKIILNPDDDHIVREGDEILVIAEDDDTYSPAPPAQIRRGSLPKVTLPPKLPERILFCGWRRDIHDMIKVLDAFLPSNSELWIFSDVRKEEREQKLADNLEALENIILVHREGNPVIRRHLEALPLQIFDSILILADEKLEENVVIADSRSLATLLLIRDIQSKRLPLNVSKMTQIRKSGFTHSSWIGEMRQASDKSIIISEILDSRTKHLVSVTQIGDYVLSNELVSMALAMVAEEKQINRVLEELFAEEGNELYIRSAEFYLYDQEEVSFFEIMIRARQRQEIVIGYRRSSQERAIINPPNKAALQRWSIEDVFVVLSWDE